MADVFITGATGFVGGALLRRLASGPRRVRALVRHPAGKERVEDLGAEAVLGDLMDSESLEAGMAGCETVYHVAGLNAFCLREPSRLFRVNVDGSRNLIAAAARAGVRRAVYTSSAATLGEEPGTVGREDSKHRGWFLSAYERSKCEAELAVCDLADRLGIPVVVVNPSSVQGPGRTTGTARLLIRYLQGRLHVAVATSLSLVDVDDCVEGHLLAEERGRPGERYVLNGATLSTAEALEMLGRVAGIRRRVVFLPRRMALVAGTLAGGAARMLRREASICREAVRTLVHGHVYDGSRATRELGLRYAPLEETLRRTVVWYRRAGLVG
ncbi:MAG: NAD-dependent epimerase/dehydratase family protein [Acidimicrobiia bacterium]